jgi:hypothetical protein
MRRRIGFFGIVVSAALVALQGSAGTVAGPAAGATRHDITVFPVAGTLAASPQTQISFRGVSAGSVPGLTVTGSRTGGHRGRWIMHSDGKGVSFEPRLPFRAGETVSVRSDTALAGSRNGVVRFTIAVPADEGPPADEQPAPGVSRDAAGARAPGTEGANRTELAAAADTVWAFHSRPDLKPPVMQVTTSLPGRAPGLNFVDTRGTDATNRGPLIYDQNGDPVWYSNVPTGTRNVHPVNWFGENALVWFDDATNAWVVANSAYRQIATFKANGYVTDHHDVEVTPWGTALIVIYNSVDGIDTSPYEGGQVGDTVVDGVLQEIDVRTGAVLFEWHSLAPAPNGIGLDEHVRSYAINGDYVHINSATFDTDGNILVSARHLSAVFKVNRSTGAVMWRLGGKKSDFSFVGDPGNGPSWPHDARRRADGAITVFDNGVGRPTQYSRGAAWEVDMPTKTATLVGQWRKSPDVYTPIIGSNREQANGNVLVSYGVASTATEWRGDTIVWDVQFADPAVSTYRTYRALWQGFPLDPPDLAIERAADEVTAYTSWNGSTQVRSWQLLAGPHEDELRVVATQSRTGFETRLTAAVTSTDTVFATVALSPTGTRLARSDPQGVASAADGVFAARGSSGEVEAHRLYGAAWTPPVNQGGSTDMEPAGLVLADRTQAYAVKALDGALEVKFVATDGTSTSWLDRGGMLVSRPSLIAAPGAVRAVACGTDRRVWTTVVPRDGAASTWRSIGGDCSGGGPGGTMAANGDVVFTTVFADGSVRFRVLTTSGYTPWRSAGGKATSGVGTAPEPGTSRVLIAVRGTDGSVWVHALAPGDPWRTGRWSSLGGRALVGRTPSPVVGASALHLVVYGSDGALFERVFKAAAWGAWTRI